MTLVLCAVDLARFGSPGRAREAVAAIKNYANPLVRCGLHVIEAIASLDPATLREASEACRRIGWNVVCDELVVLLGQEYRRRAEPTLAARSELDLVDGNQRTPVLTQSTKRELTPRERDVARRALAGASSKQIAGDLTLSTRTVDNLLGRVYRKCGVNGRDGLSLIPRTT